VRVSIYRFALCPFGAQFGGCGLCLGAEKLKARSMLGNAAKLHTPGTRCVGRFIILYRFL
jgi:hypothetical protein